MLASAVALTAVAILAGCGKTETPEIILDSGANAEITSGTVEDIVIDATSGANSGVAIYTGEDVQAAMEAANAALAAQQEALKNAGVDVAAVQAAQQAALNAAK